MALEVAASPVPQEMAQGNHKQASGQFQGWPSLLNKSVASSQSGDTLRQMNQSQPVDLLWILTEQINYKKDNMGTTWGIPNMNRAVMALKSSDELLLICLSSW